MEMKYESENKADIEVKQILEEEIDMKEMKNFEEERGH